MIFNNFRWSLLLKVVLLFVTITAGCFLLLKQWYVYEFIAVPVILFQLADFYRMNKKAQDEVSEFVEAVQYRDFSRYFNVKRAPVALQPLRKGFNDINAAFKVISKEKETQYQYLQKILELVDTGILSYEMESGEVVWMNESLKQLLQLPYLRTVHSLERRDPDLCADVMNMKPGDHFIATAHIEKNTTRILLSATAFQTGDKKYKLVAFQNVNEALDETESKAWQKLLRVMTHEIMNSVAPISSLAGTLKTRLEASVEKLQDKASVEDLTVGIETIKRRSEGLLKFAETYRNLNKITAPNVSHIYARDLFENLYSLMEPTLEQKNIELEIVLKDLDIALDVDVSLIEQVLINLVLNAIDAVKDIEEPRIFLSAYSGGNNDKTFIKVADNGQGMSEEVMDKIFVPFFSTKKTGSGIGLSLCKQIMMLHKGTIQVQSKPGEGTAFILQFN
jgi:two-component system, NtrC family, nitrogen regulation sensor histidine kinase NtrY